MHRLLAGRYELVRSIGSGGFSEVYLAHDLKQFNREVAVKQLFGSSEDETLRKQREREIKIHTHLSSKHVIPLFDSFVDEGSLYLVFELMDHSLARYTEPLEFNQVLEWARESLKGLRDIHACGVIHRDLKPSNIFIDKMGSLRIGDFGVARISGSENLKAWSPQYVAPEIIEGDQSKVGYDSDLYSLGLVIYHLSLGEEGMKAAFSEIYQGASSEETAKYRWMFWHSNKERQAPSLHSLKPEIPQDFSDWVLKLVEKDPAKRYQSAQEALEDLNKITGTGDKVLPMHLEVRAREKREEEVKREEKDKEKKERRPVLPSWGKKLLYLCGGILVLLLTLIFFSSKKKAELILTPPDIRALIVKWEGEEAEPERNTQTYRLTPKESGSLRIYQDTLLLLSTILSLKRGEPYTLDLSSYLRATPTVSTQREESTATVRFNLNTEGTIMIAGVGEERGRRVDFKLKPGLYQYIAKAKGYSIKEDSLEVSPSRDKEIIVNLERLPKGEKLSEANPAETPKATEKETAKAQPKVITFEKTYGGSESDGAFSVQQTTDGGYIVAGWTSSSGAGSEDAYLIKTDSYGQLQWSKTYGGSEYDDAYSVQQTTDGGYTVAGWTYSSGAGRDDVYLIKTDSYGQLQWSKTYGGSKNDAATSVQQTTDGGYIVAGWTLSSGAGGEDVYLIKTDSYGQLQWSKTYGGSRNDAAFSVQQTADGGYIVAGGTYSSGAGDEDVYLIKTDSYGQLQWSKTYGGLKDDQAYSVQQTRDGGYIVAGWTSSSGAGSKDVYLIKTDSYGQLQWSKTYGGSGADCAHSVQQTKDGGYIVAGVTSFSGAGSFDVYLIKTDSFGNVYK
jgi:serine/threonine protein kinase